MQAAMNSAYNRYATQSSSFIRGRIVSESNNDAILEDVEIDKMLTAYEALVAKEIRGEIKPSYTIIRSKGKNEKGQEIFEMQTICIVNENEASKARISAMENALKESAIAHEWADKVAGFVREGFEFENTAE